MHYYQRNIGDYARDTGHLTVIEHGLYVLMLDWYYLNERPITDREVTRLSRGFRDDALTVLCEFFKETEDGWVHSYADREIAKGSQCYVEGSIRYEKYEKDGVERYSTDIIADEMQMLGGKPEGRQESKPSREPRREKKPRNAQDDGFKDDDIPW